jgi:aspartate-semialdehyde dehydrogenase
VGRIRSEGEEGRRLAFVLTLDDLRYGSALAAVLAAEMLCGLD